MRRLCVAALALAAVLAITPAAGAVTFRRGHGLRVLSAKWLDSRLVALTLRTVALPSAPSVRILLPPGYAKHPRRRYPVLYLLHGTSGAASDWTVKGDAEKVIGGRQLITVMPDIALNVDGGGWCTNWPDGSRDWETFHIDQLVPWIDANLRTIRNRGGRAIAGLSQGGFCSMSYAARHPDLFGDALAYSGAPDIWYDPDVRVGAMLVINGTEIGLDNVPPDSMFGDPATDGINWAAHDPATLAENLRWTRMALYWGNGQQGPYDSSTISGGTPIEAMIERDNDDFEARLHALDIPAYFDAYGPGTHSWPYWTRDLAWSIDRVMFDFAHPARRPARFTYTSADPTYAVYGWRVATHRTAREFSTLEGAGAGGFALAGSGSATVTTPPVYRRRSRYRVTLFGDHVPARTITLTAGRDRRLTIAVPLGPPNAYQQDTPQAAAAGMSVYTTSVTIARRR